VGGVATRGAGAGPSSCRITAISGPSGVLRVIGLGDHLNLILYLHKGSCAGLLANTSISTQEREPRAAELSIHVKIRGGSARCQALLLETMQSTVPTDVEAGEQSDARLVGLDRGKRGGRNPPSMRPTQTLVGESARIRREQRSASQAWRAQRGRSGGPPRLTRGLSAIRVPACLYRRPHVLC
jgi:hypothetical protein